MSGWEIVRRQVALAGWVTDARTGRSIAGSRVEIVAGPVAFTTRLARQADQYRGRWETMAERLDRTRTAADGHFHFVDLPAGAYQLAASLPGTGTRYNRAETTLTVEWDDQGNISLTLATLALAPTTIRGQVTGQAGDPLAMARVSIQDSGEHTLTAAGGHYALTGLEASRQMRTIRVAARGYWQATQGVTLERAGQQKTGLDLSLRPTTEPEPELQPEPDLPSKFRPTQLPGCRLWLTAVELTGLGEGDPLQTWPDSSSRGHGAGQPGLRIQEGGSDDRPGRHVDGAQAGLLLSLAKPSTGRTCFVVCRQAPAGNHHTDRFEARQVETKREGLSLNNATGGGPPQVGGFQEVEEVAGLQILTWLFSGRTGRLFKNGTSLGTAHYILWSLGDNITVGAGYSVYHNYFDGVIVEIICYNRALLSQERQQVEQYLSERFKISLAG